MVHIDFGSWCSRHDRVIVAAAVARFNALFHCSGVVVVVVVVDVGLIRSSICLSWLMGRVV